QRDALLAKLRRLGDSEATLKAVGQVLKDPKSRHFANVLRLVWERGYGTPTPFLDLTSQHRGRSVPEMMAELNARLDEMRDRKRRAAQLIDSNPALRAMTDS